MHSDFLRWLLISVNVSYGPVPAIGKGLLQVEDEETANLPFNKAAANSRYFGTYRWRLVYYSTSAARQAKEPLSY
jgi:hypothetical protein